MPVRLGIDVGGTKIEGIVLDGSQEVARLRVATPQDYDGTLAAIADIVAVLEERAHGTGPVGVGIPGTISPTTGRVKNANSAWLNGRSLIGDLTTRLRRPVRVANDANCLAMSEASDGAAAGADVVFAVIVGTGTGGGIVVHGRVLTGPNAIAGEWGHIPLPWPTPEEHPGPPCYCGLYGCVETYLCGPGMTLDHEQRTGRGDSPEQIVTNAAAGEPESEQTLIRYESRMARALASVINVLDPDVIVLGGGMSNIARLYHNVPRLWADFVFAAMGSVNNRGRSPHEPGTVPRVIGSAVALEPAPGQPARPQKEAPRTRLVQARHGDSSGVRGAAWLWPSE